MLDFKRFVLDNGLTVLLLNDVSRTSVVVNTLYKVGSKNEVKPKTGLAHLFEHLMFTGTHKVPEFDEPVQLAGGENNAFTNADYTNFYTMAPANNLDLLLFLEADRMADLALTKERFEIQQKVVLEEFYETTLNVPFGEVWHQICGTMYQDQPYEWPTIGHTIQDVEGLTYEDAKAFYDQYYCPNNAILSICGPIDEVEVLEKVTHYFGKISRKETPKSATKCLPLAGLPEKDVQKTLPCDALYMVFPATDRLHPDYEALDLLTDLLAEGKSSWFYQKLIKETELFDHVDAWISGSTETGLLVLEGKLNEGVSLEAAEAAIWQALDDLKTQSISDKLYEKLINRVCTGIGFSKTSLLQKAMSLCYYEMLGNANLINKEMELYQQVTKEHILSCLHQYVDRDKMFCLRYIQASPQVA